MALEEEEDEATRVLAALVEAGRLGRELVLGASDGSVDAVLRCAATLAALAEDAALGVFELLLDVTRLRDAALACGAARSGREPLEEEDAGVSASLDATADLAVELDADLDVAVTRVVAGVRTTRAGREDMVARSFSR